MKDLKTYQTEFSFCHLGHAPGVGLEGVRGGGGGGGGGVRGGGGCWGGGGWG